MELLQVFAANNFAKFATNIRVILNNNLLGAYDMNIKHFPFEIFSLISSNFIIFFCFLCELFILNYILVLMTV